MPLQKILFRKKKKNKAPAIAGIILSIKEAPFLTPFIITLHYLTNLLKTTNLLSHENNFEVKMKHLARYLFII